VALCGYKAREQRTQRGGTEEEKKKKNSRLAFLCFFSKKQRRLKKKESHEPKARTRGRLEKERPENQRQKRAKPRN